LQLTSSIGGFLVEKNSVLFIAFESSNENGRKDTLLETNMSQLGKRKIIFSATFKGDILDFFGG